jgi:hypothetical protein
MSASFVKLCALLAIVAVLLEGTAAPELHKTLALIGADDSMTLKAETREAAFVAESAPLSGVRLQTAAGL